jgi:hypothetical protein
VTDTVVRLFRGSIMATETAMVEIATTEMLEGLREGMSDYGDALVTRIESGTRQAFATSIADMLSRALWIVVLGVVLIAFVPEIPMRTAQEKAG